ncbi:MAG: O-antigen ligase [Sulfurospirillaceae bacterium]|nr:O-antigen ligase [Sulfurospirillaceae bacterium]MDD2826354.1 O-antigen ligase [Sulfurospirillaceae bacterium]
MFSFILLITGFFMYISLYKITKDKLNPQAIFLLLWYLPSALSSMDFLYNHSLQRIWNTEMMLVIYLSGVAFYIPSILLAEKAADNLKNKIYYSKMYKSIFNFLMIMSIIAFIIRFKSTGFEMVFFSDASDKKSLVPLAIPFINYFELMIPYLGIMAFFELHMNSTLGYIRRNILISFFIFSTIIYSLLFSVSRGGLLISILAIIYFYNRKKYFTWKKIFLFLSILLIAIVSFSFIRLGQGSSVFLLFGDDILSMVFSSVYSYIAFNYENLHQLIRADIPMSGVWYSWKFLLKPFFYNEYELNSFNLCNYDTLFFNARTYLYPFYHDLHFAGILLYPFLLGLFLSLIVKFSNKNILYLLLVMALQKSIFFTAFGNYFFGELVIFFPFLVVFIIIFFNKKLRVGRNKNFRSKVESQ